LTDIDHLIQGDTFSQIMSDLTSINENCAYRFSRLDYPDLTPYKMHPNSWLMTKELYQKMGGYDERFAGYYGTDGDFRDRLMRHAKIVQLENVDIIRVGREHIPDASTTTYKRKKPEDGVAIRDIKNKRGSKARPHTLTFEWEQVV